MTDHNANESVPEDGFATKIDLEAALIGQEHRLVYIIRNIVKYWKRKNDRRRSASFEAVISRIFAPSTGAAAGVTFTAGLGLYFAYQANQLLSTQNELILKQTEHISIQTELAEATRRAGSSSDLGNVLNAIAAEIEKASDDQKKKLSPGLYGRVIALSRALRPYKFLDNSGNLITKPLSPERGQLLISLLAAEVDLTPLVRKADFSYSFLDSANLRGATLKQLNFSSSSFKNADLTHADMRSTEINYCDFSHATLVGTDFSYYSSPRVSDENGKTINHGATWVTMSEGATFDAANLSHAIMPPLFYQRDWEKITLDDAIVVADSETGSRLLPDTWELRHLSDNHIPPQFVRTEIEYRNWASRELSSTEMNEVLAATTEKMKYFRRIAPSSKMPTRTPVAMNASGGIASTEYPYQMIPREMWSKLNFVYEARGGKVPPAPYTENDPPYKP